MFGKFCTYTFLCLKNIQWCGHTAFFCNTIWHHCYIANLFQCNRSVPSIHTWIITSYQVFGLIVTIFCGSYMFLSVLSLVCLCARLFLCALWSPAGKWLTFWLSFVVYNCQFFTLPLVSWVRYVNWLYQFLIFAPLLTMHVMWSILMYSCFPNFL